MIRLNPKASPRVRKFDMTPMIDVVFQLIIFFMFTSQFGQIARTEVDLPRERGTDEIARERPNFVIDIAADGELRLEGRRITYTRLIEVVARQAARGEPGEMRVLIRPDRAAAAAHLNRVAEGLAALGVRRWAVGTADAGPAGGTAP